MGVRLGKRQLMLFFSGLLILTLGVALTVQSRRGTGPFDAVLVGLSRTFGLTIGNWEIILGLIMVVTNALMSGKRPEYLGVLTALVTGLGIDLWLFLVAEWLQPEWWIARLGVFSAGMLLTGLGTAVYLCAHFAPMPFDRLMLIIRQKSGWSVARARIVIQIVCIILAFFLGGSIGPGTVLAACLSGLIIGYFMKVFKHDRPFSYKNNNSL
ncbi:YitT family protein [Paenibacillus sp. GCM10012307]|uniref:YitT family protein n=1 Tax=Paenibacillus roseus TaxID=2798579 RepID=A0A934MSJ5_9BACL|nr:YitT family protein [Paenibacillus roseus]MBJ6363998.1 YitT family protein [Paenibacillus roseus]